jgi:hypothetical protein
VLLLDRILKVGDFVDLQSGVPGKILSQISGGKGGFWEDRRYERYAGV